MNSAERFDVVLQIRSGGFAGAAASPSVVLGRLEAALPLLPVSTIIMGWHTSPAVYQAVARYLRGSGIALYLWLPVFSEIGLLAPGRPVVGPDGTTARNYHLSDDENFEFYCPNDPANTTNLLAVFERYFAPLGFDGVFLDKIRYPSFVNGPAGGLTCFCPYCREIYAREGIDPTALQTRIEELPRHTTPFGVTAYQNGKYSFRDELWGHFFNLRQRLVYDRLSSICHTLRGQSYKIGLDVFAPFMSQFVGQDIPRLSTLADFIKPMMYATTSAPAGLPFELAALLRETGTEPGRGEYCRLLGLDQTRKPFDLDFTAAEMNSLAGACACPVYPGIELNYVPGVAEPGPAYIESALRAYNAAAGVVLCWDLLAMPPENIRAAGDFLGKSRPGN